MIESLKYVGLSNVEIKLYEVLLGGVEKTVLELSKTSKINRSYCYEALDRLLKKGFITKLQIRGKLYWRALSYDKVLNYIDQIRINIDKSLKNISRKADKRKNVEFEFYNGKRGIMSLCDGIAESKTKVIGFGAEGQLKKFFPYSYNHFFKKIRKNKVKFELITLKDKIPIIKDFTKFKSFKKEFPSCVEINVYEDKTILFFWKDDLEAIKINDLDVANSFRNYHRQLWEKASK